MNKREEEKNFVDNVKFQNDNYKMYENKVAEIKATYAQLMDDYNKYSVMTINSPFNVEYKQIYSNIRMNIQNIFSSLFQMSNKIDEDNNVVLNNMDKVDVLIAGEKKMSQELETDRNIKLTNERSSTTLNSDYKTINYEEIYRLLSLIFSIIMVVIIGFILNQYYTNTI